MPLPFKHDSSFITAIGLITLGVIIGALGAHFYSNPCVSNYRFINPAEVCGKPDVIKKADYTGLRNSLESYIVNERAAGDIASTSVYFRDLEDGPVFGIHENADFAPASLLKVPLAMVYLTQAEDNPDILTGQASVAKPSWHVSEYYPPSQTIDPTQPHSIEELLAAMLTYSDNNAYGVLQTHLYETGQQDFIRQTFLELGFIDPSTVTDDVMSVRQYAGIFRALYNVSFLNAALSEKVLGWLSKSDFNQGLRGGVPADVVIAHKFGERFSNNNVKQLHDCGIIYYPGNPYLLCVMTSGMNFDALARVIQHISGAVYEEVNSRRI
jgi:beta-lactamase class A